MGRPRVFSATAGIISIPSSFSRLRFQSSSSLRGSILSCRDGILDIVFVGKKSGFECGRVAVLAVGERAPSTNIL